MRFAFFYLRFFSKYDNIINQEKGNVMKSLNITNNLLKAIGCNSNSTILKEALLEYMPSIMAILSEDEIFILNKRYSDNQDYVFDYKRISLILRKNMSELLVLENIAKKKLATLCIKLPIISYMEKYYSKNMDQNEKIIAYMQNNGIKCYNDYLIKSDAEIKDNKEIERFWNELGLLKINEYICPTNLENNKKITIDQLGLSARIYNSITREYGIINLDQLLHFTEKDFMNLRNLGSKCVIEIKDKIHSLGLSFFNENNIEDEDLLYESEYSRLMLKKQILERELLDVNRELELLNQKNKQKKYK